MADVGGQDERLGLLRLERQKAQINLNMLDGGMRLVELQLEKERTEENLTLSKKALADLDKQIAQLKESNNG